MTLDKTSNIKVVTSNNFITACNLDKISLKARKLLYIAIAQCKQTDKEFFQYEIPIKDFAELMGIASTHVYQEADSITDELMHGFIKVAPENEHRFIKYSLFQKVEYDWHKGQIVFKINQEMTDFFLGLKKSFTQPLLNDFLKMNSTYSMEIWHVMQREMRSQKPGVTNEIIFDLSLEELRKVTGTSEKFEKFNDFKRKVFDKAIREIKDNCGVVITYEYIKRGRFIVGFRCTAVSEYHVPESEIKQETKDKVRWFQLHQKSKETPLTLEEREEFISLSISLGRENVLA